MPHIKNGGAAFPANPNNAHCEPGMTLRDYFAAKAMQGWLANSPEIGGKKISGSSEHAETLAKISYVMADAMLAAREVQS